MERWTNEEEKYLIDNYMDTMYCDIAKALNKTEGAIRAKCFELQLVKNNAWTEDEILFLKNNYNKLSVKEIAEYLNRTPNSVRLKANKSGCKKSPYNCDYNFFKTIDTEDKAYWLGFIAADGWVTITPESNSGSVGIELMHSDIKHLSKFNKSIHGNYKITTRDKKCKISTQPEKTHKMCQIRVFSIDMVNDLRQFGISPNKTYEFNLPNFSDNLMRHFIRGYFDGDGCVRTRKYKLASGVVVEYPLCDIASVNNIFLEQLREYLYRELGICSYIYLEQSGVYRLCIHKNEHTIKFLNYMYDNTKLFLDRKYNKYLSIINDDVINESLAN